MPRLRRTPCKPALHRRTLIVAGLSLAGFAGLACTDDSVADDEAGSCDLLAGDLVISEIMANPMGADDGLEWFEIYNASGETIDLEGRLLGYSRADGTASKAHFVGRSLEIPPGGYLVVGAVLDEVAGSMDHLDYGYGGDLGNFGNTAGRLVVGCEDGTIVDEVFYEEVTEGVSRGVDGTQVPDAAANDSLANWCDARSEYPGADFLGTPGATNDVCGSASTCLEGGDEVDIVRPMPGDLVITEVHANPDAVGDDFGEWFEILATADVHLNGLGIATDPEDDPELIAAAECMAVSAGEYVIVGVNEDAMVNGGLPPEAFVWEMGLTLGNSAGSIYLSSEGELLDTVSWTNADAGVTTQLDPDFSDPTANDDLGNWCEATEAYGAGDLGTPGAVNGECPIIPPDGQCFDVDLDMLRDIVPVEMGGLLITELLSNPEAVADADGEFFELRALAAGDLNGLELGKAGAVEQTVTAEECIEVEFGDYVLFAREADPLVNGGLPEPDLLFDFALNNSSSDLFVGYAGEVWDQVSWASRSAGKSYSYGAENNQTVAANDDPSGWCDGVGVYGDGDEGTPGAENNECGAAPMGQCLDLDTMMMRNIDAPALGELVITEIMPNPDAAADADGEWFELYASAAFDLNDLQIGKGGSFDTSIMVPECVEIAADSYVVLARSDDPLVNGDIPNLTLAYDSGFSISNNDSDLQVGYGGEVLDVVAWSSSPTGATHSLDPGSLDPALNDDADAAPWCTAVDPYGDGDLGTPGVVNPECGGGMMGMEGQCMENMMWRDIVAPAPGDLVITEVMANPEAVADSAGEWFEIRALAGFDLNELELGRVFLDGALDTVNVQDCIPLAAGDTALFAVNADSLQNGGLPAVDYEIGFGLTNSGSGVFVASGGVLLDEVAWSSVTSGSSTALDPDFYDPNQNDTANDADPAWCYAATPYGDGDNGTPKADNPQCP